VSSSPPQGVFENNGRGRNAVVASGNIKGLRLVYGFRARHPLLLALLGVALTGIGLASSVYLLAWLARGGMLWRKPLYGVPWLLFGPPAVYEACQRGYVLEVETASGLQRLEFSRTANHWELETFLDTVERAFGYSVERDRLR
jgi:hypothetical protein